MAITGGCQCGAVRFAIDGEPISIRACWCRDCQYWGSGGPTVNAVVRSETLTVTGALSDYVSAADSGSIMHRRFCPACGTHLFSAAESRPHVVIVRVGAFDDPERGAPQGTIWRASAPSWACIDPDLPAIDGQPAPVQPPG